MLAPISQRPTGATSIHPPKVQRPSPLQRRSTLKRSIDETSIMDIPSSPSKRTRVTFDSEVEIVSADDEDDLSPDVITEQVRRAVQRHKNGDHTSYENFVGIFTASADQDAGPSSKMLRKHLTAVLANIAGLTKECTSLVDAVLFSEWIGRDEAYFALFVRFLSNLAAAHRGHQTKIMEMIVELLGPQRTRRLPNEKPVRQLKIHRRVLQTLQHLTRNVPSTPAALATRLASRLDFDFAKPKDRMTFIQSYMQMINYVPDLTSDVLACIMRELIKLDVCLQDGLDDGEDLEDELVNFLSSSQTLVPGSSQAAADDSDDDDLSTSDDSDVEDLVNEDPITARHRKLREVAKQVDQIMEILFNYYDRIINSTALQIRHNAVERLIGQFKAFILPTYRSRHPQFLLFHFAQTDPIIVDRFVTECVEIMLDKSQPTMVRHSAAAYFSGFVGRGAQVAPIVVHDCLELLCEHLSDLQKTYTPLCTRGPDLRRFGDFYATFQAILYIFCFRWRDVATSNLDDDDEDDMFTSGPQPETYHFPDSIKVPIESAILSPLNPLRICTPEIVDQFAKLTAALQMLFIHHKIEQNKHVRISTSMGYRSMSDLSISDPSRDMSWLGDNGMIEGYFPFDPYELPRSKHWVEDDYVAWRGIPGEEVNSDEEEDEEMDEQQEDELKMISDEEGRVE
jgi:RNA polymerase I-specific transcription initiation factor RRN3